MRKITITLDDEEIEKLRALKSKWSHVVVLLPLWLRRIIAKVENALQ